MQNKGNAGVITGAIIGAIGIVTMLLPFLASADMMAWGYGTVVIGLLVFVAGLTTFLLFLARRRVLRRMQDGREVLARWQYSEQEVQAQRAEELDALKGMPIFGGVLGGIFAAIGFVFFLTDPDDMGVMLGIMLGVGAIIAGAAWLSTTLRRRAILCAPGEAVFTMGGVQYMGELTDWNGVTSRYAGTRLETLEGRLTLVVHYAQLAGRHPTMKPGQVNIPVPQGREAEAEELMHRMNNQKW